MKTMAVGAVLGMALSLMVLPGCESDSTLDDYAFRNLSSHAVTVTLRNTATQTDYRFTLAANGGEQQYPKALTDPLTYTYAPTATVAARRDGDVILFEDR